MLCCQFMSFVLVGNFTTLRPDKPDKAFQSFLQLVHNTGNTMASMWLGVANKANQSQAIMVQPCGYANFDKVRQYDANPRLYLTGPTVVCLETNKVINSSDHANSDSSDRLTLVLDRGNIVDQ